MEKELGITDISGFVRRRKKGFMTAFLLLFIIGLGITVFLPPIFRSVTMIRVEDQQIPKDYVQPTITDYVEERIEKISQQILSRPNLMRIVGKYNLYPELKDRKTPTEIVAKMRKDINLETIVAEMKSRKAGRNITVTVAFNLSYEGKDPETVKKVAETLGNLYLEEDIKRRELLGSVTTDFLQEELKRLENDITLQEKKISQFKKKHLRELPADQNNNVQAISRLERAMDNTEMQIRLLQEKKLLMESKLATVEPLTPIVIDGQKVAANPSQRLKELHLQLASMQSVYSDKHPDIKKIKREISELETQVQSSDVTIEKLKRLEQLENDLAVAQAKLGAKHPDVKAMKIEIQTLSKDVKGLVTEKGKLKVSQENPDNPVYINLKTQVESYQMEIDALQKDKADLLAEVQIYQSRLARAPNVERQLAALTRDYENSQKKHGEISNKLMDAKASRELEGKKQGERFSIASPAYLPLKPTKPNRLAILLLSFLIAFGVGSLLAVFREGIDNSIRSASQLKEITGVPVLTSVSYIVTDEEKRSNRLKILGWFLILFIVIGAGLFCVNQYVIKLDDLWTIILDRLKMFA
jgi:uncharacterized protein involved in exopolysaccharide biosynthesis